MGYYLEAIISKNQIDLKDGLSSAKFVRLGQGLIMVPLTDELFAEVQATDPENQELLPGFEKLSGLLAKRLCDLSANGLIAYVEAEFFGGVGGQSTMVWEKGKVILNSVNSKGAINGALRMLGITPESEFDEFVAVGLHRHRSTNEW